MLQLCRWVVIALCLNLSAFWLKAEACAIQHKPVEASDVSGVLREADSIEVVELVCENCADEQFTELTFQSVKTKQTWKIDGYIIDSPENDWMKNPDAFDPWRIWGMPPGGCSMVPAVRPEGFYDLAIKDDKIIWLNRHDAYMASHFVDSSASPVLSDEYYAELASHYFQSADLYWTCDGTSEGRPSVSDADFTPYGHPQPAGIMLFDDCIRGVSKNGIIHLNEDGIADKYWTRIADGLVGNRLEDEHAQAEFSQRMIDLMKK